MLLAGVADVMIDDSLLSDLKKIGFSEYEAKVYVILTALRVASAREIHEQTKIPRGKIYETLTSLAQKGFIISSGKSPARYSPVDIIQTFERLKRESISNLETLYQRMKTLETETPEPVMQGYKLYTEWTRDHQIRMMFRRAKSEIILLCDDPTFLSRYRSDILHASKRIYTYLVVSDISYAEYAPVKCYIGGNDISSSFFHHEESDTTILSMKLLLLADRHESLSILDDNGMVTGIFICPDIFAGYLSRKIIEEVKPVEIPRT